jgi:hypothetical protein
MRLSEEEQEVVDAVRAANPTDDQIASALARGATDTVDDDPVADDLVEEVDDLDDDTDSADAGEEEEIIVANQG